MVANYKVITLCGSTRFKDEFMEAQKRLTLEGNIVISVGLMRYMSLMSAVTLARAPDQKSNTLLGQARSSDILKKTNKVRLS